jgi:hypothetical protein
LWYSENGGNYKRKQEMAKEIIFLVEESSDGGYEARALGYSIYTEAETLEELRNAVKDAVHCHFEEPERPQIIRLHLVREEVLSA